MWDAAAPMGSGDVPRVRAPEGNGHAISAMLGRRG